MLNSHYTPAHSFEGQQCNFFNYKGMQLYIHPNYYEHINCSNNEIGLWCCHQERTLIVSKIKLKENIVYFLIEIMSNWHSSLWTIVLKNSKEGENMDQQDDRQSYIHMQTWPTPSENWTGQWEMKSYQNL